MTPDQAASAAKPFVLDLGDAFSQERPAKRRARELGLTGWSFYVAGRGGALGDVRADTVASAMGFIAPAAVAEGWDAAKKIAQPSHIAAQNLAECCRWGREHLDPFPDLGLLLDLAERVVVEAEAAGLPLFAAWRAMPIPDDSAGAHAAVLLRLLREHRGGAHLLAIRASGLSPIEAIISGPDGETGATAFGWQPPFPALEPLIRRRILAEALTDRIAGEAYRALTSEERQCLVTVLQAVSRSIGEQRPARGESG